MGNVFQFQDENSLVEAVGLYYMQLQREERNDIEWSWGKGLRSDLLSDTDVTLFTGTIPVYGVYLNIGMSCILI